MHQVKTSKDNLALRTNREVGLVTNTAIHLYQHQNPLDIAHIYASNILNMAPASVPSNNPRKQSRTIERLNK